MDRSSRGDRRSCQRVPSHLRGTLTVRVAVVRRVPGGHRVEETTLDLPVMIREIGAGGLSLVLSQDEVPPDMGDLVAALELAPGSPVRVTMPVGKVLLPLRGRVVWASKSGGRMIPATRMAGIDFDGTPPTTRATVANWVFLAADAVRQAAQYAQYQCWEEAREAVRDLGLHELPGAVLAALLEDAIAADDPAPWFPSDPITLRLEPTLA